MSFTLYDKIWNEHLVHQQNDGTSLLYVDRHLVHEVTSPQAFAALEEKNLQVSYPETTIATVDHIVPTKNQNRPFSDPLAEQMLQKLRKKKKVQKKKNSFFLNAPNTLR